MPSHTISKGVSHLKELGYVCLDMIKNDKGEIIQRRIYPNDTPYMINRTYPYSINGTEGMSQKGQYNNIIDNNINNYKIDRLFNYILDKENEIENSNNKEQIDESKSDKFPTNTEENFSKKDTEIDYDYE